MLLYLDTFDGGDYPEFVMPGEAASKPEPMQKLRAVFDLLKPFDVQFLAFYGAPKCEPIS
jgi:hypothetical protein